MGTVEGKTGSVIPDPKNLIMGISASHATTPPPNMSVEVFEPTMKPTPSSDASVSTPTMVP